MFGVDNMYRYFTCILDNLPKLHTVILSDINIDINININLSRTLAVEFF